MSNNVSIWRYFWSLPCYINSVSSISRRPSTLSSTYPSWHGPAGSSPRTNCVQVISSYMWPPYAVTGAVWSVIQNHAGSSAILRPLNTLLFPFPVSASRCCSISRYIVSIYVCGYVFFFFVPGRTTAPRKGFSALGTALVCSLRWTAPSYSSFKSVVSFTLVAQGLHAPVLTGQQQRY